MSARKTERLLNLVICLLATRRYLSADQIRRTVAGYEDLGDEAFKRKFERDKEDLRDLGIPLETGSDSPFDDEPGYRIRRDDYSLPDIAFEPAELAVLGVAARTWQHASLGGQAFEAVLKLRAAGVDIDDAVPVAIETRVATSEPAFEPLRRAATDRRPVEFDYRTPGARRHVEPWGLVSWRGRWYLAAHDTDRADTRVFRLSRIVGGGRASRRTRHRRGPQGNRHQGDRRRHQHRHGPDSSDPARASRRSVRTATPRVVRAYPR